MSSSTLPQKHPLASTESIFQSFWMGGFECATHRRHDGRRLDCVASTRHDEFARQDFERLHNLGIHTARDGVRWHLIEKSIGHYDWSSVLGQIRAARDTDTQIIWDLFHYGWPDELNIFAPRFVDTFARFAGAFAQVVRDETDQQPVFAPVNEISFFAWGGGDMGFFNPFSHARGNELKRQLVRATIGAVEAIWEVFPGARIVHPEPIINVIAGDDTPRSIRKVAECHGSQFLGWDMIAGRLEPELGGHIKYLDILGANYYPYNQWIYPGGHTATVTPSDARYRPLSDMLVDVANRYERPILLSETGIEFDARPDWTRYIGGEVRAALKRGVPLEGVCWYPIVNHPGWDDDRHCQNGLWDYPNELGERAAFEPMEQELREQIGLMNVNEDDKDSFDMSQLNQAIEKQGAATERSREESAV